MNKSYWIILTIFTIVIIASVFYISGNESNDSTCFVNNESKSYTLMSPESCMVAKFACEKESEYFADSCGCGCIPLDKPVTEGKLAPIYCTNESRDADACTMDYNPVCAWYDPAIVQCIKYPCAFTAGNACGACQNSQTLYYTSGECPLDGKIA